MNAVSEQGTVPKGYTVNEMIDMLNEIKNKGKGNYKMMWGANNYCAGYPIIAVTVNDKDSEVRV